MHGESGQPLMYHDLVSPTSCPLKSEWDSSWSERPSSHVSRLPFSSSPFLVKTEGMMSSSWRHCSVFHWGRSGSAVWGVSWADTMHCGSSVLRRLVASCRQVSASVFSLLNTLSRTWATLFSLAPFWHPNSFVSSDTNMNKWGGVQKTQIPINKIISAIRSCARSFCFISGRLSLTHD